MHQNLKMLRLGGTAIAAVLALHATPALAQEATSQDATPQISIPDEPAPVVTTEPAPVAADPLAAAPAPVETAAPVAATTTPITRQPARRSTVQRRAAATTTPAPVAAPAPAAEPAPLAAVPPSLTAPAPTPVVAEPLPAAPAPVAVADETLPIALGAGLGLLALGGAAYALTRRRRRDAVVEQAILAEPAMRREPAPAAPMRERSAFHWGSMTPTAAAMGAGRNWIERARRGPTPENPFLSMKKRLQRAAFFERRERAVAAGKAQPVSPMAGLPKRLVERLKSDTRAPAYGFSYAPA